MNIFDLYAIFPFGIIIFDIDESFVQPSTKNTLRIDNVHEPKMRKDLHGAVF